MAFDTAGTHYNVWRGGERMSRERVPLNGRNNVENVLGALAICHALGVDIEAAAGALEEFRGVRRRQELRGEAGVFVVIEDFAHHPTAVRENIGAMRARYPDRSLWAVFEPRTNTSRRRHFEDAYAEALSGADHVLLADVYRAADIPEAERLRPERVVEALVAGGVDATFAPEVDDIIDELTRRGTGSDVALIMSNGEFGGVWDRLLGALAKKD